MRKMCIIYVLFITKICIFVFFLSNGANTNNLRKKKLATLMDWFHNMQVVFGLMKFI